MSYFAKVKEFVLELGYEILQEITEDDMLIINNEDNGVSSMVLDIEGDLLIIEQKLLEVTVDKPELFKQLLQANRRLVYGAFVLDESGKHLIFRDTLELLNLDKNELESSLSALALGLVENIDLLITISGEDNN
jgi:hypothetical protein